MLGGFRAAFGGAAPATVLSVPTFNLARNVRFARQHFYQCENRSGRALALETCPIPIEEARKAPTPPSA